MRVGALGEEVVRRVPVVQVVACILQLLPGVHEELNNHGRVRGVLMSVGVGRGQGPDGLHGGRCNVAGVGDLPEVDGRLEAGEGDDGVQVPQRLESELRVRRNVRDLCLCGRVDDDGAGRAGDGHVVAGEGGVGQVRAEEDGREAGYGAEDERGLHGGVMIPAAGGRAVWWRRCCCCCCGRRG